MSDYLKIKLAILLWTFYLPYHSIKHTGLEFFKKSLSNVLYDLKSNIRNSLTYTSIKRTLWILCLPFSPKFLSQFGIQLPCKWPCITVIWCLKVPKARNGAKKLNLTIEFMLNLPYKLKSTVRSILTLEWAHFWIGEQQPRFYQTL